MIRLILADIEQNIIYLPVSIVAGAFFLMCTFFFKWLRAEPGKNVRVIQVFNLFHTLLVIYFMLLIQIVFLSRKPGSRITYDLMPGATWTDDLQGRAYVIENILLFIPYGFLLPFCFEKMKFLQLIVIGFVTSFLIEVFQYITGRGYFQTDDLITNVLGTFLGVFFPYVVLHFLQRKKTGQQ